MSMPSLLRTMLPLFRFRLLLHRLTGPFVMSFLYASCVAAPPQILLGKLRRVLFFLVGVSFLSIVLTACATFGGGSGGVDTDGDGQADSVDVDDDNDGVMDGEDIDDDGDGLIEIATAAELDAVRYALRGNGRRSSRDGALNTTGCGGIGGITSCSGYELIGDISLAAYASADEGKGWLPLGHDTDSSEYGCQGTAFDGTFEGNGFMISDLNIRRPDEDCVGLFGHIAADSEVRNLKLSAERVRGRHNVGGLVGGGISARIDSSSVEVGEVSGTGDSVGGLVGDGGWARIDSSSVEAGKVSSRWGVVGGLVGFSRSARIYFSSVVVGEVSGDHSVGGLVGDGGSAWIDFSSVVVSKMRGRGNSVGGLMGSGRSTRIHSSSVVAGEVSGTGDAVGGLVGYGISARIHSSSVMAGEVSGTSDAVGGLVGSGEDARIHSSSVVVGEVSGTGDAVGGLVGDGSSARIYSSSVVTGKVSGTGDAVGGLVGDGSSARIHSSSVVVNKVRGIGDSVGGLIGDGESARIISSSVEAGEMRGGDSIGGLVGNGEEAQIFSSSVEVDEVRGGDTVGNLVGFGEEAQIFSSSVVVDEGAGRLVGDFTDGKVAYSYAVQYSNGDRGYVVAWPGRTKKLDLEYISRFIRVKFRKPTDYTGIYADWDKDMDIFGDGMSDEPLAVWCDKDYSGSIEWNEQTNDNRVWDFGTSRDYPAIRCTPMASVEWRSWWFYDRDGKPQLDRTRLDKLLPSSN